MSESEEVLESITANCRSLTKTKFTLEDDDVAHVVSVLKERVDIGSPVKYASKSSGSPY